MNSKTYILGAGFSKSIGLPMQAEIMKDLVNKSTSKDKIEDEITKHIVEFFKDVFLWNGKSDMLPTLEDIFTFIDLSASEGKNLGMKYWPSKLRAIRRFLIYKIFCVLDKNPSTTKCQEDDMNKFINEIRDNSNIISLNWDIVLENNLKKQGIDIDYGIEETNINIEQNKLEICAHTKMESAIKIAKIHGSSNWVYCDNCNQIYCDLGSKAAKNVYAGIYVKDIKEFYEPNSKDEYLNDIKKNIRDKSEAKKCPNGCGNTVGTHIATCSFEKSFRTKYFMNSWSQAEKMLNESTEWIFIGYSLPEADYEFKHMLKCSQLRSRSVKKIKVVILDDTTKDDSYVGNKYKSIFGNNIEVVKTGLTGYLNNL